MADETAGRPGADAVAMAAHIHNVRLMWLEAAKVAGLPAKLDKEVSVAEAGLGLSRALRR